MFSGPVKIPPYKNTYCTLKLLHNAQLLCNPFPFPDFFTELLFSFGQDWRLMLHLVCDDVSDVCCTYKARSTEKEAPVMPSANPDP